MKNNKCYYWATSKDMKRIDLPNASRKKGFFIQHNPNLNMYRINNRSGVPISLAGYSPHLPALVSKLMKGI